MPVSWSPDINKRFKINCDAAVSSEEAVACVIRDGFGNLVDFFGKRINAVPVFVAEALAIREACIFCCKSGISNIVSEGESANDLN